MNRMSLGLAAAAAFVFSTSVAASQARITGEASILLSPDEPAPVRHAVEDLQADFRKVLGREPKIVHRLEDAGSQVIAIGRRAGAPESFALSAERRSGAEIVALEGADMRGTLYAIYQFSQDYLGVDPMYYWTDKEPAPRQEIVIPESFFREFGPPVFRHRGFFLNDEDLLTGWAPGDKERSGISLSVWNKVYETLLRLKADMVVPGSWIFPDEPAQALLAERGLIMSIHHATPLDVNVARWPQGVPYNYSTHPEILERAWENAVKAFPKDREILWEVGLRGLSDESYAALDPVVRGDETAAGALISKAIAKQVEIVKREHPDAEFITNLWSEGAGLMDRGLLTIPPEVQTVWADNGWGWLQDGGKVKAGQGAYYHVAFYNLESNQLSEAVPVARMQEELGRFQDAGATNFLLLNTSDIRPVAMTTRAVMEFGWWGKGKAPPADEYYRQWAAAEFGAEAAAGAPALFRNYFAAPAKMGPKGVGPEVEYGDMIYHYHAREMLLAAMVKRPLFFMAGQGPLWRPTHIARDGNERDWVEKTIAVDRPRCREAAPRWDNVWTSAQALQLKVEPSRRDFYRASVLAMIAINRESNRMLLDVMDGVEAMDRGDSQSALASLGKARAAIHRIKQAEADAEYGKWKNWYRGDWLTGIDRTAELIDAAMRHVKDPWAPLPVGVMWNEREAYEHITGYQGDRVVDLSGIR